MTEQDSIQFQATPFQLHHLAVLFFSSVSLHSTVVLSWLLSPVLVMLLLSLLHSKIPFLAVLEVLLLLLHPTTTWPCTKVCIYSICRDDNKDSGENTYWSLLTCINGGLGGMVSLCAGCDAFHPGAAFAVGIMGGFTMWWVSNLVRRMGIDDPLGNC